MSTSPPHCDLYSKILEYIKDFYHSYTAINILYLFPENLLSLRKNFNIFALKLSTLCAYPRKYPSTQGWHQDHFHDKQAPGTWTTSHVRIALWWFCHCHWICAHCECYFTHAQLPWCNFLRYSWRALHFTLNKPIWQASGRAYLSSRLYNKWLTYQQIILHISIWYSYRRTNLPIWAANISTYLSYTLWTK